MAYIPIPANQVTGSFGVVNYVDAAGNVSTYLVFRSTNARAQSYDGGNTSDVTIPFPRGLIGALTGSLASAVATTNSGTF